MNFSYIYGGISFLFFALSLCAYLSDHIFLSFLLLWVGAPVAAVSYSYANHYNRLFRKKIDGQIPFIIKVVFFPFLVGVNIYNWLARRKDSAPAMQLISDGLYLGRRMTPLDGKLLQEKQIGAILDVTAEFDALHVAAYGLEIDYLNVPVLDHQVPSTNQLRSALNWIHVHRKQGKNVLVHCALGQGRSVTFIIAYLMQIMRNESVSSILEQVKARSPRSNPNAQQLAFLEKLKEHDDVKLTQSALLVVNPVAGGGKWAKYKQQIIDDLSAYLEVDIHETKPDDDLGNIIKHKAVDEQKDIVIAAGGDGTLTAVASHLVNTTIKMGMIPLGTANALNQVLLGIDALANPIKASCHAIVHGKTMQMDTAKCNGRLSLLLVGIGFETDMIEYADRDEKNVLGVAAYLKGFGRALSENKSFEATVTVDDAQPKTQETTSLIVANAAPRTSILAQGGQIPKIDDGQLDVTWLKPNASTLSKISTLWDLWKLEQPGKHENIDYLQGRKIRIETDTPANYVIDGEVLSETPLEIECLPSSLSVFVPENFEQ